MFLESGGMSKVFVTIVTRIWFFTCMDSFMFLSMIRLTELFVTIATGICFVICMDSFMYLSTTKVCKFLVTVFTGIWFFTCMNPLFGGVIVWTYCHKNYMNMVFREFFGYVMQWISCHKNYRHMACFLCAFMSFFAIQMTELLVTKTTSIWFFTLLD